MPRREREGACLPPSSTSAVNGVDPDRGNGGPNAKGHTNARCRDRPGGAGGSGGSASPAQGEAESILGDMKKQLETIESEAYKEIQIIEGQADAQATEVYALAYNQSPDSVALYEFVKSLETYRIGLDQNTMLILSTDSELMRYFKGIRSNSN